MSNIFQRVQTARPGRSVFNLSYQKKFTCDMGQLIPVMCDEVVPGDIFKIGNEAIVRFQPLITPIMHEVNVFVHYFFVPYRILWEDWEDFITGGIQGDDPHPILPRWEITTAANEGSLWDYMGFPTGVIPTGRFPLDFPRRAYINIYNEYYRDETLQSELDFTMGEEFPSNILRRSWEKDYFTSALPWQQRGTAPSIPLSGSTSAIFDPSMFTNVETASHYLSTLNAGSMGSPIYRIQTNGGSPIDASVTQGAFNNNTVDFSSAITFDVADLRLIFQIQKWLERNARCGARYTEFLQAHFAVSPRDERLQRPEYIGGSKNPVIISEVLQTSESNTTAQGNMSGHGIAVNQSMCASYRASEFGLIMGIMSVMPRTAYQQGIDRQWLRQTKYDFYFPEFANLSEQAIERVELYASANPTENTTIFGYQGRYDEMRFKRNMVCGQLRSSLNYWHLGRVFSNAPVLNDDFIRCEPSKRIFAVQDEPGLVVNFGNLIKAIRPMPVQSNPGLIDHN